MFELRAQADVVIDDVEGALADLKADGLIEVEGIDGRMRIKPDERVVPDADTADTEPSLLERVRRMYDRLRP